MERVDFYLLSNIDEKTKLRFACIVAERAVNEGLNVFVHTKNEAFAKDLDELMWVFKDDSFLPHSIAGQSNAEHADIVIGNVATGVIEKDLMINIDSEYPPKTESFTRVAEIVLSTEKKAGRIKYRNYQDNGIKPFHHDLGELD